MLIKNVPKTKGEKKIFCLFFIKTNNKKNIQSWKIYKYLHSICPRSLDPLNVITYYRKWVMNSRTCSAHLLLPLWIRSRPELSLSGPMHNLSKEAPCRGAGTIQNGRRKSSLTGAFSEGRGEIQPPPLPSGWLTNSPRF